MTSHHSLSYPDKYIIALTGGIASGKTFVANLLRDCGAEIVDTDLLARRVVEPGSCVLERIREEWGDSVMNSDGTLNRRRLGNIIFNSEEDRLKLNGIMHPEIRKLMNLDILKSSSSFVVLVIPLLFETDFPVEYDEAWVVYVPREVQEARLMERDSFSREEAVKRIDSQMPMDEKVKYGQVVIDNSGDPDVTRGVVFLEWQRVRKSEVRSQKSEVRGLKSDV